MLKRDTHWKDQVFSVYAEVDILSLDLSLDLNAPRALWIIHDVHNNSSRPKINHNKDTRIIKINDNICYFTIFVNAYPLYINTMSFANKGVDAVNIISIRNLFKKLYLITSQIKLHLLFLIPTLSLLHPIFLTTRGF